MKSAVTSTITAVCPHLLDCGWSGEGDGEFPRLINAIKDARMKRCSECSEKSSDGLYLCLKSTCGMIGCSRNQKGHAMKHYKSNKSHCLSMNILSLQIWCYECDEYVHETWPLSTKLSTALEEPANFSPITGYSTCSNGAVGLYNLGNSCYINAALQVLLNCPAVAGFFRDCRVHVKNHEGHTLSQQFMHLFEAVHSAESAAVSPARLIRVASSFNPAFHGYSQQDSMDFFRMMLDLLHEELKYPVPAEVLDDPKGKSRRKSGRLACKGNGGGSEAVQTFKSIISDTFGGVLRSEVKCHRCKKVYVKDDQFFDVSLPLTPGPTVKSGVMSSLFSSLGESLGLGGKDVKLEGAFVNFCLPEVLDGKDRYMCENCKELVQSTKTLSLKTLPQILCVQLKRFRHDSYFSSKINTFVEFPMNLLDLRHFLHREYIGSPLSASTEYDLIGIVNHRGSFNGGHYVAYCRNLETGNWLEFDDSRVRNVTDEEISQVQAYLLFYIQRADSQRSLDRKQAISMALEAKQPGNDSSSFDGKEDLVYVSKQWFNRFLHSTHPGPIDSFDVLCPHGNLKPKVVSGVLEPLTCPTAELLVSLYGDLGGRGILKSPMECVVCVEEAENLRKRRLREEEEVMRLDSSSIGEGEFWYLIDSTWLSLWTAFKNGGSSPPGPISNHRLFTAASMKSNGGKTEGEPRPALSRGVHYRGVNERVWSYFWQIYGGGPVVKRKSISLYM